MSPVPAEEVLAASAAWVYVPDDAREVRTEEFHLIAYPEHWSEPTVVTRVAAGRPGADLVADVLEAAAGLGRDAVTVWVTEATRPVDLEDVLRDRGELVEELDVLARPLDDLPDLAVPDGLELRRVVDEQTVRDQDLVGTEVFGGSLADDASVAANVRRLREESPAFVAYRDGRPVATGGLSVVDGVARLWGGAVLEEERGTGLYRALLDARLRAGRDAGCGLALVKGRVTTSGPILRRAGFTAYGQERGYRVTR